METRTLRKGEVAIALQISALQDAIIALQLPGKTGVPLTNCLVALQVVSKELWAKCERLEREVK